jgi:hypothetical protein
VLLRLLLACCAACAFPGPILLRAQLRAEMDTRSLSLPAVGDSTLVILSPSLLELTQISTEKPDSAWPPPMPPAVAVSVGGRPLAVEAVGMKRRVLYAPLARRDLRVATEYYLRLSEPIALSGPAQSVEIRELGQGRLLAAAPCDPRRTSPAIHVNQEGYAPSLPKKAMIGYYLGDMGEMEIPDSAGFTLIDARTGATVYRGSLTLRRDVGYRTSPLPYQKVLEADFSEFTTAGEYQLQVPGLGASLPFLVDDGIALGFARTYALGLYHQRCGTTNELPFTRFVHDACHTAPAQVPVQSDPQFAFTWATIAGYGGVPGADHPPQIAPPLTSEASQLYPFVRRGTVDVSGGHHDAGDYSKYTINSAELIHYLVFAVDSIPGVAQLDNLGLPESGDGISDVLQEAKWEADYLAKLQDSDGGFYFLVYPKNREYESNVLPEHGDPQVVWPKTTSATAAAVAALAQCASSPQFKRHYPGDAARYLRQAQLGWSFLTRAIAKYGKAGAYQKITFYGDHYTHDDELAWAACELFLATGDASYQTQLFQWFPSPADPVTFRWGWWRMSESWGNAIRSYAFAARSGRLPSRALDADYLAACEAQIVAAADDAVSWSRDNAYATPFPPATKAVHGAGWYFSLDQASDMAVAYQIDPKAAYLDALVGAMNYEGGCNPVNVTYLSGLGRQRQREIVDQYAENDRRVLPPSGIPIGNIQAAFQFMPNYGSALREATYPGDDAAVGPYPFYDRWSDAFNVTQEFITVNQARGFLAAAFLACRSPLARRPWTHANATIVAPPGSAELNRPVTLRLEVPGQDLAAARIVWEARDQEPAFGPAYVISPKNNGAQWVEAELEWPDGRRAFAEGSFLADSQVVTWLNGSLPADAIPQSDGGDGWNWTAADAGAPSRARVHPSTLSSGLHEHWFTGASATLAVRAGDTLFAWVCLDAAHPPAEIMLMWHDGSSWEHRAYWGANTITYGQNGSAGRHPAGSLPSPGRWVQLRVPATAVGLRDAVVSGMGFSQVDGRATWSSAGVAH